MEANRVILIGESHYHGLNLLRCFGGMGIKAEGIIVGSHSNQFLESSKYWDRVFCVAAYQEAIELLLREFAAEERPAVVIPWSDGAVTELDKNYDRLKDSFLLSSVSGKQNALNEWMSKTKQVQIAEMLGLPVSPSIEVSVPARSGEAEELQQRLSLPLFLKPVTSCEGTKRDMRRIDTWDALDAYMRELSEKGFHRILVQEYMHIDAEYDLLGYCSPEGASYTLVKKCRIWPSSGGAASFAVTVESAPYDALCRSIIQKLLAFGFSGPFDFDLFQVGGKLYFNEINWRSSANVYGALASGNNYPYLWYLYLTGQKSGAGSMDVHSAGGVYFINEIWDFKHVIKREVSLPQWLKDVKRAKAYAFWSGKDPKPFFVRLLGGVPAKLFGRKA